jgi:MFS family permease
VCTQVALAVQVYDLTGSTLAVGLLGAAEFVPIVLLALVGGAMADAFDRRKLIWGAELTASLISARCWRTATAARRSSGCCGRRRAWAR